MNHRVFRERLLAKGVSDHCPIRQFAVQPDKVRTDNNRRRLRNRFVLIPNHQFISALKDKLKAA